MRVETFVTGMTEYNQEKIHHELLRLVGVVDLSVSASRDGGEKIYIILFTNTLSGHQKLSKEGPV